MRLYPHALADVAYLMRRMAFEVRRVTANAVANLTDRCIFIDSTAGAVALTLPDATQFYGEDPLTVKWVAGAGAVTLVTVGGQTIDGAASPVAVAPVNTVRRLCSDGQNYFIV